LLFAFTKALSYIRP